MNSEAALDGMNPLGNTGMLQENKHCQERLLNVIRRFVARNSLLGQRHAGMDAPPHDMVGCSPAVGFVLLGRCTLAPCAQLPAGGPDGHDDLLRQLSGFPDLRRLELRHCGITDEGLRHLPAFAHLETLDLSYSSVADDGSPYIGRLTSLTSLDLGHTRVTGRGFHRLAELERLEVLILTLTPIRDEALSRVEQLQRLRYVHVHGCRHLTRGSVEAFQQALPTCELRGTANLQRLWKRAADEDTSPTRR